MPDVVFLDINLPGRDGVSLATQLSMLLQPPRLVTWVHTVREEFATYYPLAVLMRWLGGDPFVQPHVETTITAIRTRSSFRKFFVLVNSNSTPG